MSAAPIRNGLGIIRIIATSIKHTIFCQGARFVQSHPEYLILYTNIASAGMARFAEQISQEVEHYTADHLSIGCCGGIWPWASSGTTWM